MEPPTLKEMRVLAHFGADEFAHLYSLKGVGHGVWERMAEKGWLAKGPGNWYRIAELGKMIRALHRPSIERKFGRR